MIVVTMFCCCKNGPIIWDIFNTKETLFDFWSILLSDQLRVHSGQFGISPPTNGQML